MRQGRLFRATHLWKRSKICCFSSSSSMRYFCVIILVWILKKCSLFNEMQQCRRMNLLLWRLSSIKQYNQEAIMKSCSKWLLLYIAITFIYNVKGNSIVFFFKNIICCSTGKSSIFQLSAFFHDTVPLKVWKQNVRKVCFWIISA